MPDKNELGSRRDDPGLDVQEKIRLIHDGVINYSSLLVSGVVGLVLVPIMLHGLGQEVYGLWVAAMAVTGLATIVDFGLASSVTQAIAAAGEETRADTAPFVTSAGTSFLAIGLAGGAVVATLGLLFSGALHLSEPVRALAPKVFLLASLFCLFSQLLAYARAVLVGLRRFDAANLLAVAWMVLAAAGTIVLLQTGYGLIAVAGWQVASVGAGAMASLAVIGRLEPSFQFRWTHFDWPAVRERLPFSLTSQLTHAAIRVVWDAPALLIGLVRGSAAIVPYHIGQKFPVAASQISWSASEALFPAASPEEQAAHRPRMQAILEVGIRWVVMPVLALAVLLWIVTPTLLEAWIGQPQTEAAQVLRITSVAILADAFGVGAFYVLWGRGFVRPVFLVLACVALAQLGLGLWLLQRMGVVGMAWAMLISMTLGSAAFLQLAARACRTSLWTLIRHITQGLPLAALACGGAAAAAHQSLPLVGWIKVVAVSAAGGGAYVITLLLLGGAREEERFLRRELARLPVTLGRRFRRRVQRGRQLSRAGIRLDSLLLFPLRRRLPNPCNRIDLRQGLSLTSPPDEPLLLLFQEIWMEERYTRGRFVPKAGQTVIDIGAHVGVFTVWAASRHPEVEVVAVEPSPRSLEFLRRNVATNRLNNVEILACACGAEDRKAPLFARGAAALNTLYTRDAYQSRFTPVTTVDAISLDTLFKRFRIRRCHFLKLDCEGAEYDILFNAEEDILHQIDNIGMEYHQGLNEHTPGQMASFLERSGFAVKIMPPLDQEGGYLYATRSP